MIIDSKMRICMCFGYMKIYICVQVLESQKWIGRSWTNNNAESFNHVLKSKTEWRLMKRVTDLIESVRGLVEVQLKDLKRALHGDGNFTLASQFARHHVSYNAWQSMTSDRRQALFSRYLRDSGKRKQPTTVTASDGGLSVLNTTKVARKPGQRQRPRATRTTSKQT